MCRKRETVSHLETQEFCREILFPALLWPTPDLFNRPICVYLTWFLEFVFFFCETYSSISSFLMAENIQKQFFLR